MKKVLLPIVLAATIFASCSGGGDDRVKGFENKEFGEFIVKQEKILNDMVAAVEAKDSAKIKDLEAQMSSTDKEAEQFMTSVSEADQKKATEIMEPALKNFFDKMMGSLEGAQMDMGGEPQLNPEDHTQAPAAPEEAPAN